MEKLWQPLECNISGGGGLNREGGLFKLLAQRGGVYQSFYGNMPINCCKSLQNIQANNLIIKAVSLYHNCNNFSIGICTHHCQSKFSSHEQKLLLPTSAAAAITRSSAAMSQQQRRYMEDDAFFGTLEDPYMKALTSQTIDCLQCACSIYHENKYPQQGGISFSTNQRIC